jgi:hypothetical protein
MPKPGPRDRDLLDRAAAAYPDEPLAALTRDRLAEVARRDGCDLATALFYRRIAEDGAHAPFVARIDAASTDRAPRRTGRGKVFIAPAAFFRELPRFGGDGRVVAAAARQAGFDVALLPVESAGSVTENAARIADALAAEPCDPLVVVSLSKGSADVRLALERLGGAPPNLRAWVQICGLLRGSPIIDAILDSRLRRTVLRAYLVALRADLSVCAELRAGAGSPLSRDVRAPDGVDVVNVVGFPLASHLRGNTLRRYRELRALGPNDGSTLLADALLLPGSIYPVWGADHYFRVPEASTLLDGLFGDLAARWPA